MTTPEINGNLHHDENLSTDAEGFLERMKALFASQETVMERIDVLVRAGADGKDELDMLLDKLTDESLAGNPESIENIRQIQSGRLSNEQQKIVRDKQREIFNTRRLLIAREAGVPDEAALDEVTQARRRIAEILADRESTTGAPEADVLEMLGIITRDKDGKEIFTYPRAIMPESTNQKWDIYIGTVVTHLRKKDALKSGRIDRQEVGDADTARRYAHNAVARDVDEVLGLDQLPGSSWSFEQTRNLLAKMRESKFPTVKTAEKEHTEANVIDALNAVRALATRVTDLKSLE